MESLPLEPLALIFSYLRGSDLLKAKLLSSRCKLAIDRYWIMMDTKLPADLKIGNEAITVSRGRIGYLAALFGPLAVNGKATWLDKEPVQWHFMKDGDLSAFFTNLLKNIELRDVKVGNFNTDVFDPLIEHMLLMNIRPRSIVFEDPSEFLRLNYDKALVKEFKLPTRDLIPPWNQMPPFPPLGNYGNLLPIPAPNYLHPRANYIPPRAPRRQRTSLTRQQRDVLEACFDRMHYPDVFTRIDVAHEIGVEISRVEAWFKTRRARWRAQQNQQNGQPRQN